MSSSSHISSPSATLSLTPNPTTPPYSDDVQWITAYLTIHVLSDASRVYSYILWLALLVVVILFAAFHYAGLRSGVIGSYWSKWSVRRRTWRKKHSLAVAKARGDPHRQPLSLPSNAQLFTFTVLLVAIFVLSFVGPDYFAPGTTLWTLGGKPSVSALRRRADTSAYTPYQPQYTISKAWWTSGNRTGLIAFALFPLCILFALKSSPFALLAYTVQLHFDKLSWLHRWTGRIIWVLTAIHIAFWSVQLVKDRRVGTGKIAYMYAWEYQKFIFGWIVCIVILRNHACGERCSHESSGICCDDLAASVLLQTVEASLLRIVLFSSHHIRHSDSRHVGSTSSAVALVVSCSGCSMDWGPVVEVRQMASDKRSLPQPTDNDSGVKSYHVLPASINNGTP